MNGMPVSFLPQMSYVNCWQLSSPMLVQYYIKFYLLIYALHSLQDSCVCAYIIHHQKTLSLRHVICIINSYNTSITAEAPSHQSRPVPKSDFSEHVKAMHKERDSGFEKVYMVCLYKCV